MSEALKRLGLSGYESVAYMTLLSMGVAEAREIYKKTKIPYGRVYSVLGALSEKGLVEIQDSRPKKFMPVEPSIGLKRLLDIKRSQMDKSYDQLLKSADEAEKQLSKMNTTASSGGLFWKVAVGFDEIMKLVIQRLTEAQREVLYLSDLGQDLSKPAELMSAAFQALVNAVDRDVNVKLLMSTEDPDAAHVLLAKYGVTKRFLRSFRNRLEVRFITRPVAPFDVVDGEKVTIKVRNPVDPQQFFAAIAVWDGALARELKQKFEELWKQATE